MIARKRNNKNDPGPGLTVLTYDLYKNKMFLFLFFLFHCCHHFHSYRFRDPLLFPLCVHINKERVLYHFFGIRSAYLSIIP